MKKIIIGILSLSLILCFAGCAKNNEPTTTTEAQTKTVTEDQNKQTTTKTVTTAPSSTQKVSEQTTKKDKTYPFLYKGYWYRAETNKVVAIKLMKDGKAKISYYKIRDLKGGSIAEETTYSGEFTIKDDTLKLVNTDLAQSADEYDTYTLDSSSLTYLREDPEGSSKIQMLNNSNLSADFARSLIEDEG